MRKDHLGWGVLTMDPCRVVALLMLLAGAMAASSQASSKKLTPVYPIKDTMVIEKGRPIMVLPPKITHGSFRVGGQMRTAYIDILALTRWIHRIGLGSLRQAGFVALESDAPESNEDPPVEDLIQLSDRLVRQRVPQDDLMDLLRGLDRGSDHQAVLVQHLKIKVAPKGSWNPHTGALAVGMSNSDLRGVIFDCKTGEVLWRGEMYIRMIPEVGNRRFESAVAGLFGNLSAKE